MLKCFKIFRIVYVKGLFCSIVTTIRNIILNCKKFFALIWISYWRNVYRFFILKQEYDRILLLSKNLLDVKKFYREFDYNITWDCSDVRVWLNDYFYHAAFSKTEKEKIITVTNDNEPNSEYGTYSGEKTIDKVFLLSMSEAMNYLDYNSRKAKTTKYTEKKSVDSYNGLCNGWWLRTVGRKSCVAVIVDNNAGEICTCGNGVNNDGYAVRPAIWIKK